MSKGYLKSFNERYSESNSVEYSYNGVLIIPDNAPKLKDLFPDREDGPHQQFYSPESCLVCHKEETKIGKIGVAKEIPHKVRENCTDCHTLK